MTNKNARGRGNLVIGLILVGLGVIFLLGRVFDIGFGLSWPFFIIIPGLLFFVGMILGGKDAGSLAIPGSIVTMVGLILLYQNITNHWESWAYVWALIWPTSVGIGLIIHGTWSKRAHILQDGIHWARVGIVIFLIGGVFFEVIIGISGGGRGGIGWSVLLIVFGVYLLMRNSGLLLGRQTTRTDLHQLSDEDGGEHGGEQTQ
ncbi:MAG: hypothetical protein ACE5JP_08995 [Candidatus Bipolaricaulia bacterium]